MSAAWQRINRADRGIEIPDALWRQVCQAHPLIARQTEVRQSILRDLSARFLHQKRFHGAGGLSVTDAMALTIAAQACVLLIGWAARSSPAKALWWYDDFVGVVLHPDAMLAPRFSTDAAGVVHRWNEPLVGEAMERGPVTLAWSSVAESGNVTAMALGTNVVIHEFAHKLDMRSGEANGCPPLPRGFMGHQTSIAAQRHWDQILRSAFEDFRDRCSVADRFGGVSPWLDAYGATSPIEFFAVACEAYFVNRPAFAAEFPSLPDLFECFFAG